MDIFKENFPNNVISDLYKLCFQNYRASLKSMRSVQISILEPKNYPRSSKN